MLRHAPKHRRTKTWRFTVFSGPDALQVLGELEATLYKGDAARSISSPQTRKKIWKTTQALHVIEICMARQACEQIPEPEEIKAMAHRVFKNLVYSQGTKE
jgi:hypothetical protein